MDESGEQARMGRAAAVFSAGDVALELVLDRVPKFAWDDRLMLAGMGDALVNDLAKIDTVSQQLIEATAGNGYATAMWTAGAGLYLDAGGQALQNKRKGGEVG